MALSPALTLKLAVEYFSIYASLGVDHPSLGVDGTDGVQTLKVNYDLAWLGVAPPTTLEPAP